MYQIELSEDVVKGLKKLPVYIQSQIKIKIESLKNFSNQTSNIKALVGEYRGLYRLRSGDYRIIFEVKNHVLIIVILDVFHRGKGY